jgi:hypothetical protein
VPPYRYDAVAELRQCTTWFPPSSSVAGIVHGDLRRDYPRTATEVLILRSKLDGSPATRRTDRERVARTEYAHIPHFTSSLSPSRSGPAVSSRKRRGWWQQPNNPICILTDRDVDVGGFEPCKIQSLRILEDDGDRVMKRLQVGSQSCEVGALTIALLA